MNNNQFEVIVSLLVMTWGIMLFCSSCDFGLLIIKNILSFIVILAGFIPFCYYGYKNIKERQTEKQ